MNSTTLLQNKPRYHGLKVTREEYLDLHDDGFQYDMIDGVLYMSPSAEFYHGKLQLRISHFILTYLEQNPLGELVTEVDVLLPDKGDVLRPDISFIKHDRMHLVKKHIHGAPDLVVEILSEATEHRDLGVKADRYLSNGVQEYWIIDPAKMEIQMRINQGSRWEIHTKDILSSMILPGFHIAKATLFL